MDRDIAVAKLRALAAGARLAGQKLGKNQGRTPISRKPKAKTKGKKRR